MFCILISCSNHLHHPCVRVVHSEHTTRDMLFGSQLTVVFVSSNICMCGNPIALTVCVCVCCCSNRFESNAYAMYYVYIPWIRCYRICWCSRERDWVSRLSALDWYSISCVCVCPVRVVGGLAAHGRARRQQCGGRGRRSVRVLHVRGVGHPGCAGRAVRLKCIYWGLPAILNLSVCVCVCGFGSQQWEILHVLRRTVSGHHVQYYHAPQDAVLHGQHHHSVHGHLVPDGAHVLPAVRQRREGIFTLAALN